MSPTTAQFVAGVKKHMQALHEVDMEKFKSEQLIIFNNKLAEEIKNISIIINA